MTLMSEITRVSDNIKAAYTALDGKGATLPAEGSQNSANLADTIDSIPAGGGGGAEYATLRAVMDKVTPGYTFKQAYEDGWSFSDAKSSTAATNTNALIANGCLLYGLYFDFALCPNTFYITDANGDVGPIAVRVPEGAVVTDEGAAQGLDPKWNGGSILKIDFTGATEKWIVLQGGDGYGQDSVIITPYYNRTSHYSHLSAMENVVTWMECDFISSTYTSSNKYTYSASGSALVGGGRLFDYVLSRGRMLRGFHLSDNVYISVSSGSLTMNYVPKAFLPASPFIYNDFVNFVNDQTSVTYGQTELSSLVSNGYWNTGYWQYITSAAFCPFVLDLSTLSNALYISSLGQYPTNSTANGVMHPLMELFIKIPAQNVDWCQYLPDYTGSATQAINFITPAAMTYLADNAPSVSGKTLKIGGYNKANNPAAVATLEGKGWIVS